MDPIVQRLEQVHARIRRAAEACGRRAAEIRLVAVSKRQPASAIKVALAAGQVDFGENYVQEALQKIPQLDGMPATWHFIGPIQSNKTRDIATRFDWVHSLEREKIARRLNEQRPGDLPPLQVCVQVNVSGEASKSGVAPEEALRLCRCVAQMPRLRLRGLMALPEASDDADAQRAAFRRLRELRDTIARDAGLELDTLSMGMSGDLEAAIAEGATLVRIGTAVFGPRPYS